MVEKYCVIFLFFRRLEVIILLIQIYEQLKVLDISLLLLYQPIVNNMVWLTDHRCIFHFACVLLFHF